MGINSDSVHLFSINSVSSDFILVACKWPLWEYLHHATNTTKSANNTKASFSVFVLESQFTRISLGNHRESNIFLGT